MSDDADLVARAAAGDDAAFGALVRRHTPRMYRVALRITGTAAAAEVDAVLRAIGRLEVSQRVPLVLRELEGLSYDQVAEVLDVNVGALRSRLHRARVALLAELRER